MKKVLFTGATGLLGGYFLSNIPKGFKVIGTFNNNSNIKSKSLYSLDITSKEDVLQFFKKFKPDIVVHAASIGNVDYCETHKEEAHEVNVKGTKNVLYACREINAKVIFTSSNAVYNGKKAPYIERSKLSPLDVYGKTKAEGELVVRQSTIPYVIVRLMTMYGWPQTGGRSNPVKWIIEELKSNRKINVVDDIYNNHLYAGQAASVIWAIIKKNKKNEIYNLSGKDCISRYELALKVAKVFDLDSSLINSVKSDFFKNIAKRPKNTCFVTQKIEKDLNFKPMSIDQGLKFMKDEKS